MSSAPPLTVLIPTRNRAERLEQTLQLIAQQERPQDFEVVVVDNGSTDDTAEVIRRAVAESQVEIVGVSEPRPGTSAACNTGIEAARGKYILRIGHDTEPISRDLFRRHLDLLQAADDERFAVLGLIVWKDRDRLSEFMRWLDSGGPQHHYHEIDAGWVSPRNYFYGSHVSLAKSALLAVGGFDERFPAAFEDHVVGQRLENWGLRLRYHPELILQHDHPATLDSSLSRMEAVGRYAALFNEIEPAGQHERIGDPGPFKQTLAVIGDRPLTLLSRVALPRPIRHRVWHYAHLCRMVRGYRLGPPETEKESSTS